MTGLKININAQQRDIQFNVLTTSHGRCSTEHFNPFPPRPTKIGPFNILLCLTPDDFTHQGKASGWKRVNCICPSVFLNPFLPRPAPSLFYSV